MIRPEGCNHTQPDEIVFALVGVLAEQVRRDAWARRWQCVQDYVRTLAEKSLANSLQWQALQEVDVCDSMLFGVVRSEVSVAVATAAIVAGVVVDLPGQCSKCREIPTSQ